MKKWQMLSVLGLVALVVFPGEAAQKKGLDKSPVVGEIVKVGDDNVLSCDLKLLKDTVDIPLSFLAEDFEIIRMDNKEEALIGQAGVRVSPNYILVQNQKQNPFKLFDRKGKFLTSIGAYGQGAGEYLNVYDFQLDEKASRIYILPWQSNQILVYDLQGNALPSIPLSLRVPKAKFTVNTAESTVAVVVLPFPDQPAVAWAQDLKGNRISYIKPGHLAAPRDFSNEVTSGHNTSEFDVNILCIMPTRVDSLYHYDYKNNRLRPCFTMKFGKEPIPWHGYTELPGHFFGDVSFPVEEAPGQFSSSAPVFYIIDKETLKGSYCKFTNDYLGNVGMWPSFDNGYYVNNMDPGNFRDMLENELKSGKQSGEDKKKLTDLMNSVQENDNNYILIARVKK